MRRPLRGGLVFLAVYLAVLGLIELFIATLGNHMSGLLLVFPALPWPLLGSWLFGGSGFEAGLWIGLVLNALAAFALGLAVSRLKENRNEHSTHP